jgi:aspartate/methionine/tyrosine aminotransferase
VPVAGSPILEMARRTAEYRAAGRRIIDLRLGEPDCAPPAGIIVDTTDGISA